MNRIPWVVLVVVASLASCGVVRAGKPDREHRVYQYVTHLPAGSLDEATTLLREAAPSSGSTVLGDYETGTPKDCPYHARVFVLHNPTWADPLFEMNRETAPFAAIDRVALFEDENGVHVSLANPRSIDRTVMMDDPRAEELSLRRLRALREMVRQAIGGRADSTEYGEKRDQGHIGRTMGVMAGGDLG